MSTAQLPTAAPMPGGGNPPLDYQTRGTGIKRANPLARYVRWLQDFGMAACAILGFVVIVWTFYGVNYVMATGLHSYGFGSGGEAYVGLWALAEFAFLAACRVRYASLRRAGSAASIPSAVPGAAPRGA